MDWLTNTPFLRKERGFLLRSSTLGGYSDSEFYVLLTDV